MTSKANMQEGSTRTSTITRTSKPFGENLLKELLPYLYISQPRGTETNYCSPDIVRPNDNLSTSELQQTQDSKSETANKLLSTKHDTVSDVQATQKMVEYGHNSSSLCSSSPVTVQLTEDFCGTKAEVLRDEKRTYGTEENDSGFTVGSAQVLISDCNIKMSWNAEINTKENKSNNTHKISNSNKENHVVNSTDTVNTHKETPELATESAQQTVTDVLKKQWKVAEMFSDEGRINSICEVDSGCSSRDVEALNTSENKIQMSWNADINSGENKSKSATTTKLSDIHTTRMLEMSQPSSVNIVSTHDTVRRLKSLSSFLTAPQRISAAITTMTTSARNLRVPAKISSPSTFSTVSKIPLTTSATSNVTNPSKTSSVAQGHMAKCQLPTAPQSNSINLPACYSCVNTADTGHDTLKQGTKVTKQMEYKPIPNNVFDSTPTKIIHLKRGTPRTLYTRHPKLQFSETFPSQTVQEGHQQDTDNREIDTLTSIDDAAAKYAERANFVIRQNAKTRYEMHRFLYSDMHLLDATSQEDAKSQRGGGSRLRGSMLCRSNVRNSSIKEESEETKRKYTQSKFKRNDQKDDEKIKKKMAYARRRRHVVCNNNSKSKTPPPYSTDADASCSKASQKRVTRKAKHIPHHNIPQKCDNHFSSKSNQKSTRMSGKQMQTSKASTGTFISASPREPIIKHTKHSYKPSDSNSSIIMDDIYCDDTSTQYSTVITSSNFQNNERQTESQFQYSTPLITEHEHNFTISDNIHHNKYTAYQQEQMSQIQHNEKYFTNPQNLAAPCTGMYEEVDIWGNIYKFKSNQEFPLTEVERHTEYQPNATKLSDDIYQQYAAYDQELTSQFQRNNQYFPSSQNTELLHMDMYKNVGTWDDIIKSNRNHEIPQENVGRHIHQPNDYYETSIIQNGKQNVMNEAEANSYGYQLESNRTKLNDEDFQWNEAHNLKDACNSICNYCKINFPPPTENFVNYQPPSIIGYGHQSQYYQAFSAERNFEEVQQPIFTSNEDIHHEQIITNQKYTNVLPTTEMFQEARQELNINTSHKHMGMEQTYFNNEENTAYNWEAQTSNDPFTTYNNQMQIPIQSNPLATLEAECLMPQFQPTNNFRKSKDAQLSQDYTKIMPETSKKKYARNKRSTTWTGKRVAKPYVCSLCGERAQYKVLLQRHLNLHHGLHQ